MEGFLAGIFFKGGAVFHARREMAEARQYLDGNSSRARRVPEFTQLAGIGGREEEDEWGMTSDE
jgi:hypothetical protein